MRQKLGQNGSRQTYLAALATPARTLALVKFLAFAGDVQWEYFKTV